MALNKVIKTQYGFDISYWRIVQGVSDYDAKITRFSLEGYPNQETRQLEPKPQPVTVLSFIMPGHDRSRFDAYAYLKENKIVAMLGQEIDFTDAVDV